ncbi:MAG: preprotein translocase subunit SecG [bacterium]|nr:preprotein translocase subunit SecG [bacterium]
MDRALQIVSALIGVVLVVIILMQVKGSGLGDLLGGGEMGGITRTRRGLEKTLFQLTIGLSIAFLSICILSVVYTR